jgi:hypothetical protein
MRRLYRFLFGCRHPELVRDRVDGIASFVCSKCGFSRPIIDRTAEEHRLARELGAVKWPTARRPVEKIAAISSRRRTR